MRPSFILGLAAATLVAATPLRGQEAEAEASTWELSGLRAAFCMQLLLDPASELMQQLPTGYHAIPASAAADLHVSLRGVVEGQPEFAGWSPSRLCFTTVDSIRTKDYLLADKSGKHPQMIAFWTVLASGPSGVAQDVALEFFTNSDRLVRTARLAGQEMHEARLTVGKVPVEDENGVPSSDDRFQVKLRKTTIIWDGRLAGERAPVREPVITSWSTAGLKTSVASGAIALDPAYSQAMVGSLKVDGKDAFAKALRASPTRFAGPSYRGGGGKLTLGR